MRKSQIPSKIQPPWKRKFPTWVAFKQAPKGHRKLPSSLLQASSLRSSWAELAVTKLTMAFLAVSETIETNSSGMLEVSLEWGKNETEMAFGLQGCAKRFKAALNTYLATPLNCCVIKLTLLNLAVLRGQLTLIQFKENNHPPSQKITHVVLGAIFVLRKGVLSLFWTTHQPTQGHFHYIK